MCCSAKLLAAPASVSIAHSTRMVSPDGTFAITFPCTPAEIFVQRENGAPLMACISHGMVFGAGRGVAKIMPGNHEFEKGFDSFLTEIRTQFGASSVKELVVSGHRAFQFFCPNSDGQPCKLIVEMSSGSPLMLTGGDNPAITASPAIWHQNSPRVGSYFDSLELLAK